MQDHTAGINFGGGVVKSDCLGSGRGEGGYLVRIVATCTSCLGQFLQEIWILIE